MRRPPYHMKNRIYGETIGEPNKANKPIQPIDPMKPAFFWMCLCTFLPLAGLAQSPDNKTEQGWPLRISLMDESLSLPGFSFLRYSYQPAFALATEYTLKEKGNHDWHVSASLTGYHHARSQTGLILLPQLGYRQQIGRFAMRAGLGAGYAATWIPGPTYTLEEGEVITRSTAFSSYFTAGLSLGLEYNLSPSLSSPKLGLDYLATGYLPFSLYAGFRHFIGLSFTFYPFPSNS